VRGAPAIGIAGAMGAVLGIRRFDGDDRASFLSKLHEVATYLEGARPTAVNLSWALQRMCRFAEAQTEATPEQLKSSLLDEANRIRDEDAEMCRAIGTHGHALIKPDSGVITHCNAGSLATSEFGTALAPMYVAHEHGVSFRVYADETRPLLQGSRLTAWELQQAGIDVTLLCDNMSAWLMKQGKVNLVITGADRVAANGDAANKIGTYGLALLAKAHNIPFYIAAPSSTFDMSMADGSLIPIEERDPEEIRRGFGKLTAPEDVACYSPAFDVTPAALIEGIITERGIVSPVTTDAIASLIKPHENC